MNWHETILFIRQDPEFNDLVREAYFGEDIIQNIERFGKSQEFVNTVKLLKEYAPNAKTILDIGAGNGISSINLALSGYNVTVVEPDPSDTVGANAIRKLIKAYGLTNIEVHEKLAEEINFPSESFDIVYARQALHHAYNLNDFVKEASRVLKKNGISVTIRDHVIFDQTDKKVFLEAHPLHKFYGGENAFTPEEYKEAFKKAGLTLEREIKYFDDEINYFPHTTKTIKDLKQSIYNNLHSSFKSKFGALAKVPFLFNLYKLKNGYNVQNDHYYEKMVAGRMYSYIVRKK